MYVACNTDEEEGLQDGEEEVPGEGMSKLENIDHPIDEESGCK